MPCAFCRRCSLTNGAQRNTTSKSFPPVTRRRLSETVALAHMKRTGARRHPVGQEETSTSSCSVLSTRVQWLKAFGSITSPSGVGLRRAQSPIVISMHCTATTYMDRKNLHARVRENHATCALILLSSESESELSVYMSVVLSLARRSHTCTAYHNYCSSARACRHRLSDAIGDALGCRE